MSFPMDPAQLYASTIAGKLGGQSIIKHPSNRSRSADLLGGQLQLHESEQCAFKIDTERLTVWGATAAGSARMAYSAASAT